jgi:hypothetical protein
MTNTITPMCSVFTLANYGWFKALNMSMLNCIRMQSVNCMSLRNPSANSLSGGFLKVSKMIGLVVALKLTAVGVVAGSVLGWALMRFLSKMLYGVQPTDVVTFVGAWAILIITALVACYVPAMRATRVDPLVSLRSE